MDPKAVRAALRTAKHERESRVITGRSEEDQAILLRFIHRSNERQNDTLSLSNISCLISRSRPSLQCGQITAGVGPRVNKLVEPWELDTLRRSAEVTHGVNIMGIRAEDKGVNNAR